MNMNISGVNPLVSARNICFQYPDLKNRLSAIRKFKFMKEGSYQLEGITLELHAGESLGLVGLNGSGKTTLLRLLGGIYKPTAGTLEVNGKSSTLFDSGFGLDVESNATNNIYLRGRLLGLPTSEVRDAVFSIRDFVELGNYWDMPLRTYSSGMISRLLIAMATSFSAEILLMDEGIGTSDAKFQEKTKKRFEEMVQKSSTIVLATHNRELMQQYCSKAILLVNGRIIQAGETEEIWEQFQKLP